MYQTAKNKVYELLRWSEKWTHTDMVYLAKGSFWLTGSKFIGALSSFALALAYAHFLSKEDYGLYKYVLSIAGILGIIVLPGINTALFRSVSLGFDGAIGKAFKTKLKWAILAALAGIGVSAYYFINGNSTLGAAILAAAIFAPLIECAILYGLVLRGKKLFRQSAIYNSIKQIIISAVMITTLAVYPKIVFFILIYYIADLLLESFFLFLTLKKVERNQKNDPEIKSFGYHLTFINLLGMASEYIDKILVWHFLGPVQLAIYSFATIPVNQAQSFLKTIPTLAFPKIASQDIKVIKKTLPAKIIKFTLLLIPAALLFFIIAPFLYKLFFPQYMDSVKYAQLFVITLLFYPQRIISNLLVAHAKKKDLYILQISVPLIRILAIIILMPIYGIYGAIIAFLISSLSGTGFYYYFIKKL